MLAELGKIVGPRGWPNCHCEGLLPSSAPVGSGRGAGREASDFFLKLGKLFFVLPDEEVEGTEEDDAPAVEGIEVCFGAVDPLVVDFFLGGMGVLVG